MATFGLTPQGFLAKRFEDIVADISEDINTEFGIDINSDPDNKIKIMLNILALPLAQNWSSVQALQSMMDIDQATGIFLDYLTASKLVFRQDGSNSAGVVTVLIDQASTLTLPSGSSFYNNNNDEFITQQTLTLATNSCHGAFLTINALYSGDISFTFAGQTFLRNTVTEGTTGAAIQALADDLAEEGHIVFFEDNTLRMELAAKSGSTPTTNFVQVSGDFTYKILGFVDVRYTEEGDFIFLANTLVTAPPFSAIESFESTVITGGRYRETDEELRQRFKNSGSVLGKATNRAIRSNLLNVDGVSEVLVIENDSSSIVNGQPQHSIEAVVIGGDDTEIAETLYDVKAAGIELYGNTTIIIKDVNGQDKGIIFTRVSEVFIWTSVTYVKYPEEEFPVDGEQLIKDSIVSYINNLTAGRDVIAGRIEANIYNNVSGIEEVEVKIFGSTDVGATPIYSIDPVRIADNQESVTTESRVTVVEVT
ncbi:putative baseplate component [Pseudoalteromonas phage PH357]|nr:putative baseplate component [Pseudoalteromonas phage PH357]